MKGKRLISALLALMLVLNIALVADVDAQAADSEPVAKVEAVSENVESFGMDVPALDGAEIEIVESGKLNEGGFEYSEEFELESQKLAVTPNLSMSATTMLNSTIVEPEYTTGMLEAMHYVIIKIKAKSTGNMYLNYMVDDFERTNSDEFVAFELLTKSNADKYEKIVKGKKGTYSVKKGSACYIDENDIFKSGRVSVSGGTSYYLAICNLSNDDAVIGFNAKVYTTGTRTLKEGTDKWTIASGLNREGDSDATWFKISPTKTGLMKVYVEEFGYEDVNARVALYNKSKKRVSDFKTYDSKKQDFVIFGVKKGYTYYLKVSNAEGTNSNYRTFGVACDIISVTDRSISSKSKAKTLTMNGDSVLSLFGASTSYSSDYYKVKLDSTQSFAFAIDKSAIQSGTVTVRVYKGSKLIGEKDVLSASEDGKMYYVTYGNNVADGYATKGTYYIKVTKGTKASGAYAIACGNWE